MSRWLSREQLDFDPTGQRRWGRTAPPRSGSLMARMPRRRLARQPPERVERGARLLKLFGAPGRRRGGRKRRAPGTRLLPYCATASTATAAACRRRALVRPIGLQHRSEATIKSVNGGSFLGAGTQRDLRRRRAAVSPGARVASGRPPATDYRTAPWSTAAQRMPAAGIVDTCPCLPGAECDRPRHAEAGWPSPAGHIVV